jgi:pimeloyl-ACP methyl ester carboxylesterase
MGNYSSALSGGGGDVSSGPLNARASLIGRTVSAARVEAAQDSATTTLLYRPAGGPGEEIRVELTEALELVAQGEIMADTQIWSDGMEGWMLWSAAQDFFLAQAEAAAALVEDRPWIDRLMFPLTLANSSYHTDDFSGELGWIPRGAAGEGHVPVLMLPLTRPTTLVLLYFHGNCTDVGNTREWLRHFGEQCSAHVLAIEYPGYGVSSSGGTTNESRVNRDSDVVLRYLTQTLGVDKTSIIAVGRSIGTGPAARLAVREQLGGLVLISPYTSISELAMYHGLPKMAAWLLSERWPTQTEVAKAGCPPTLICHGEADSTIPFAMGQSLAEAVVGRTELLPLTAPHGHGHNEMFDPACAEAICTVFRRFFAVVDAGDGATVGGNSFVNPPADLFQIPSSVLARHSSALTRAFEGAPPILQPQPHLVEPEPEPDTDTPAERVEDASADAVIVGGGPNGLFTAIQLSRRCPTMRIVVLEKYNTYQRKHVLKIEARSLETGIDDEDLTRALRGLTGKVPTSKIETTFKSLATAAPNVDVRCGVHVQDLDALQSQFPNAKYFVGADGKRSIVRRERFGDCLCADYQVMRIVFCKYEVAGRTHGLGWSKFFDVSQFNLEVTHTINELVGRPTPREREDGAGKDGAGIAIGTTAADSGAGDADSVAATEAATMKTAVTLQVFVTEEEFLALMEKGYTAKQPATTAMLLEDETTEALGRSIETWLHARNEEYMEELLTTNPAITPVPLDVCEWL